MELIKFDGIYKNIEKFEIFCFKKVKSNAIFYYVPSVICDDFDRIF